MEEKKSELTEHAEAMKRQLEEQRLTQEQARIAVNTAGTNENVRILLHYIMQLSGFHKNPVAMGQNGDVLVSSTIYNVGYEALYQDLRKFMTPETKNLVERSA